MKGSHLNALYLSVIVIYYIGNTEAVACNPKTGPNGVRYCIKLSEYNGYQWVTCLKNFYIQEHNRNSCADKFDNTYCNFPCMMELDRQERGDVSSRCQCSPGDPVPITYPPKPPVYIKPARMATWCYNPIGTNCAWYEECLYKAYPTCESEIIHDMMFAKLFCQLYKPNFRGLSSQGKRWLYAARKCLKDDLLPFLNDTITQFEHCGDVRSLFKERYSQCYLKPTPSYCDLSIEDRMAVFWNLRVDWIFSHEQSYLKNILNILNQCRNIANENSLVQAAEAKIQEEFSKIDTNETIREIEFQIKIWLENLPVLPTQVEMFYEDNNDYAAFSDPVEIRAELFIRELAKNRKWKDKGVIWFVYLSQYEYGERLRLLLDDEYKYTGNTALQPADLGAVLIDLSKDLFNGAISVRYKYDSDRTMYANIMQLNGCLDVNCTKHAFTVPPKSASHSTMHSILYVVLLFISYFVIS